MNKQIPPHEKNLLLSQEHLGFVYEKFQELMPDPRCELNHHNPYTLLVAVVLSAQATDRSVNLATEEMFSKVQTPQEMLNYGFQALLESIKTIGLYQKKALYVWHLTQKLIDCHQGQVPSAREELENLPGVGRKSANVILSNCFQQPVFAVDTHVFRVSQRLGIAFGKNPLELENALMERVPSDLVHKMHHWLVLHGRYTCKARKPLCHTCPFKEFCPWAKINNNTSKDIKGSV